MIKTVEVRGVRIGEGSPKIIVPITGRSAQEILDEAALITACPRGERPDLAEWRADWFGESISIPALRSTAQALRNALGDLPLLFTFRTAAEGGQKEIPPSEYTTLCIQMAESGVIDLLDVELSVGETVFTEILTAAHAAGVKVIASSHDFESTPSKEEMLRLLQQMQALGTDICKLAVMPRDPGDVLTLLAATQEMASLYADRPLITMSMSQQGLISRLCGETFGSAATFGTIGRASAPGQIDARTLRKLLSIFHLEQ